MMEIEIGLIDRNPDQPRGRFPDAHIEQLAASIKARGLIQPISVRPKGDRFEIVAGECRWRAHLLLGEVKIKCNVEAISDQEMRLRAIVENVMRADMNPMEEARAFKSLLDGGMSRDDAMRELGIKSANKFDSRVGLLNLNAQLQALVECGQLPVAKAQAISLVPQRQQIAMLKDVNSGKLKTAEDVRHAAIAMRDAAAQLDAFGPRKAATKRDLEKVRSLEAKIEQVGSVVAAGFKDGECIAARKVSPDRVAKMADRLALMRKAILDMEHQLRRVIAQAVLQV